MSRRRLTWVVYWVCVLLLVQGLVWVTWQVLRLERGEEQARVLGARQETARLCLWRMDSWVAPLIAGESRRPYFEYRSVLPAGRAYERVWDALEPGDTLVPSPLVEGPGSVEGFPDGVIRLHFQVEPDGTLTSPQRPSEAELAALVAADPFLGADHRQQTNAESALTELDGLLVSIEQNEPDAEVLEERSAGAGGEAGRQLARAEEAELGNEYDDAYDQSAFNEYQARSRVAQLAAQEPAPQSPENALGTRYNLPDDARRADEQVAAGTPTVAADSAAEGAVLESLADADAAESISKDDEAPERESRDLGAALSADGLSSVATVTVGAFEPRWLTSPESRHELVLVRQVEVAGERFTQGVWLDWRVLRTALLTRVSDLSPTGVLAPLTLAGPAQSTDRLATIPARFELGGAVALAPERMTPARWSLVLTWLAIVAAAAAIAVVLRASMRLSDRRVRFVGAVTHELRTPLTTFRLYSQMLADGMVTDDKARSDYLSTLKDESARLAGIVENVLAYARLNRTSRRAPKTEAITPEALLVRLRPGLSRRAEQSGMDLIVSNGLEASDDRELMVDPASVERVLTNLVDNACKYAGADASDEDAETRIHLDVRTTGDTLEVVVSDYGPGIAAADRSRIFGEFQRGRAGQRADRSGLGLGLALSRGLARESGGDLKLVQRRRHGAEFLLALPLHGAGRPGAPG